MKLNELLYEAVEKISESDLPIISKTIQSLPEKQKEWLERNLERSIDAINNALDKKSIPNPDFKSLKDSLNRIVEKITEKYVAEKHFYEGKYASLPEIIRYDLQSHVSSLHDVNARLKQVEKLKKKVKHAVLDDYSDLLNEFKKLVNVMDVIKEYVFKKERKTPEEREKEEKEKFKTQVAHEDVKKIYDLLTQITNDVRSKVLAANTSWLIGFVEGYLKQYDQNNKNTSYSIYYKRNPFAMDLMRKVLDFERGVGAQLIEILKPNYEEIIKKEAEKITKDMLEHFISKNTKKLSAIASAKNNLKDVKVLRSETARGVVEGTLHLTFTDGSHFTVDNKVVMSFSKYGTPFYRFPTTFHNVVMPDDSKMKGPSEENMINVFAKT